MDMTDDMKRLIWRMIWRYDEAPDLIDDSDDDAGIAPACPDCLLDIYTLSTASSTRVKFILSDCATTENKNWDNPDTKYT